jgi:DNA replication and repair protein RecF
LPLQSLQLTNFRNYPTLSLTSPSQGMLFCGPNGSGKTNILEAIHLLCIGRSQRGAQRSTMIRIGSETCHIEGGFTRIEPPGQPQSVGIGFDRAKHISLTMNGERVVSQREWFGDRNVISFGPDDMELVRGEPALRRRFLDILICQIDPRYLASLGQYQHALANRNRLLACRADKRLCGVYEETMADAGAYLVLRRREMVAFCQEPFALFYTDICSGKETARIDFSASVLADFPGEKEWKNVFFETLNQRRNRDEKTGFSSAGPHRDDVRISLNGHPARHYASQGQCRTVALSLRLASASCLQAHSRGTILFLVDDAFAELDDARMAQVYAHIKARGQVYMTTPVSTLPIPVDLPQYTVGNGTVYPR